MIRRARGRAAAAGVLLAGSLALTAACTDIDADDDPETGITTVSFRLWDETAAEAYRESFDAFAASYPDIRVEVDVVPWQSYWDRLESDFAAGTMADVFWTNTANFGRYADAGHLVSITEALGDIHDPWQPAVVDIYTRNGQLWGVPQLWDSVVLYYNEELVEEAGVDPDDLTWKPESAETPDNDASADPGPVPDSDRTAEPQGQRAGRRSTAPTDTFLPAALALTRDAAGHSADEDAFDPERIEQYGFNAELDPQAVYLPFLAAAGAQFQTEEQFSFDSADGEAAFQYLVDLIHTHHVAPPASRTIAIEDLALSLFTDGRLALFQSGPYNLRAIADDTDFEWGITAAVAGPRGSASLVHGVAAAANADGEDLAATKKVLDWVGSADGQLALASQGVAFPGAIAAEPAFLDYWAGSGVDVSPFLDATDSLLAPPPTGPRVQAGLDAMTPILREMFRGDLPVPEALTEAQQSGNQALTDE